VAREGVESGGLSWGDQLFGSPDVVRGGFGAEISPVGGLSSFSGFEVAELGFSHRAESIEVWCLLAQQVVFMNSFQRVVRRGVHPGMDLGVGREWGAEALINAVRVEMTEEKH